MCECIGMHKIVAIQSRLESEVMPCDIKQFPLHISNLKFSFLLYYIVADYIKYHLSHPEHVLGKVQ